MARQLEPDQLADVSDAHEKTFIPLFVVRESPYFSVVTVPSSLPHARPPGPSPSPTVGSSSFASMAESTLCHIGMAIAPADFKPDGCGCGFDIPCVGELAPTLEIPPARGSAPIRKQ